MLKLTFKILTRQGEPQACRWSRPVLLESNIDDWGLRVHCETENKFKTSDF